MYSLYLSSESTQEPLTLEEIRLHLRLNSTSEDSLLSMYLTAARQSAETLMKRSLVNSQWILGLPALTSTSIELPYAAPVSTVSTDLSIEYLDRDGNKMTVSSTAYVLDPNCEPAVVRLREGCEWPTDLSDVGNPVTITYRCGYSSFTNTTSVPAAIKQWMLLRIAQMYEFREPIITGTILTNLTRNYVDGLIDRYRLP